MEILLLIFTVCVIGYWLWLCYDISKVDEQVIEMEKEYNKTLIEYAYKKV